MFASCRCFALVCLVCQALDSIPRCTYLLIRGGDDPDGSNRPDFMSGGICVNGRVCRRERARSGTIGGRIGLDAVDVAW